MDTLAVANRHDRDARITFQEKGHVYFIDGVDYKKAGGVSCTGFVKHFCSEFDAQRIIGYIVRGSRWSSDPTYQYYRKSMGQIQEMWRANGKQACEAGTAMHADIEAFYNGVEHQNESKEYKQFEAFHETTRIPGFVLLPFRTEWMIYDEEHRITGSVDMVFEEADGTYSIYDWKRSKEIKTTSSERLSWPLQHQKDCNHTQYSLQLSVYASILSRCYGLKIKHLVLIVCHPNQTQFSKIEVPNMQKEVNDMLEYRKLQLMKGGYAELTDEVCDTIGAPDDTGVWRLVRSYK